MLFRRHKKKQTSNVEYKNFVNAHMEVAEKYIPTKQKVKQCSLWDISS